MNQKLKSIENNYLTHHNKTSGITLIALVITVIILLILAGTSISMLSGNNGTLQRSADAKIEAEKGKEKEIVALAYNSAIIKRRSAGDFTAVTSDDMNTELTNQGATATGSNPITVTFTDSRRQYTIDQKGVVKYAGTLKPGSGYQWKIVSDNDNDGVISIGDEVAPLIDSIKNEHFYVISNNGNNVKLITKLPVDHATNSQSSSASGVTYDMAYCDLEGVEHDWIMPSDKIKTEAIKEIVTDSDDETVFYEVEVQPAVYYDGTEKGKIHCQGTYTKNYGLRLKQAGLNLMDFNSDSGCQYIGLPVYNSNLFGYLNSTDDKFYLRFGEIWGNYKFWLDMSTMINDSTGKVPYFFYSDGGGSNVYHASDITLRPVIQVNIDSFNTVNN